MNKDDELVKWLRFIAATSSEERIKIADGDKMFLDFNDWINNFVNSKEYKEYAKARYADDIKRSLKENVPIPAICLYTGLSEEDIKEFSEEN